MTNLIIFLTKYKKIIFIYTTIIFLIIGYSMSIISQKLNNDNYISVEKPNITNLENQNYTIKNIEIDKKTLPNIPSTLPIYSSQSQQDVRFLAQQIARELKLKKHESLDNIWIKDQRYFLSFSPISDQITLSNLIIKNTHNHDDINITNIDEEKSVKASIDFINYLNLNFELVFNQNEKEESINYSDQGATIPFVQKIGDYNLFHTNQNNTTAIVFMNTDYEVTKLVINNPSFLISEKGISETKSVNEIIAQIENQEGLIIKNDNQFEPVSSYSDINSLTITNSTIEYRDDVNNKNIIPYIKLIGSGTSVDNQPIIVEIILPLSKVF